ncbi:MAG: ACP S-malonyltransferase [Lachnospiraceae bacterium]|uniref:ACP S-malonyltransferase n=1 Tax=Roseburia sp. 1XD42-69 TaxID=2320088 RepID=UPI000EA27477|nr:ACP S-malonyltransferase [Roseburia sp. 1XD42-69]MCI8875745.1 ACP S-malonyltransferase [Lachnospiraceae bacterium]RKJ63784.1 [acyl-carrier-protein] S-malonyltransferase [Roseburia sp. 1XD42-69]
MGKLVFMFPGQGSQYVGMGKEFYDTIPACKKVYDLASEASGLDIPGLCFEENDKINITEYTQIAMLATEAAILTALKEEGITPDVTAGLSLGEYGALIASNVMDMKDAFSVVRKRGIYMQKAVPTGGAMSAVLGLDAEVIEGVCEKTEGIVSIANYNCPGQIVITGEKAAVDAAGEALKAAGAKRIVPLKVSGPFHSQMLSGAGEKLGEALKDVKIADEFIPYLANVTADYVTKASDVKPLLTKQVASSVRWQQTVERLIADGADEFLEIGPGKTLTGFMRKINRDVKVNNIDKLEDFKNYVGK